MSILDLATRPLSRFDVKNKTHRRYYAQYLKERNWGKCPVRFYVEPGYGDLVNMIESKMTWFYLSQELRQKLPTREDSFVGR